LAKPFFVNFYLQGLVAAPQPQWVASNWKRVAGERAKQN